MRPIAEAYKDFPILHKEHNGHRVIYLDSGATAQIPQVVVDRVVEHMTQHNGNPHRGSHVLAIEASEAYENAREWNLSMPVSEKRLYLHVIRQNL